MNEARSYEAIIDEIYVDFYKKDIGFESAYNKTIEELFLDDDQRDMKALKHMLNDIYSIDLSKVEKLTKLM